VGVEAVIRDSVLPAEVSNGGNSCSRWVDWKSSHNKGWPNNYLACSPPLPYRLMMFWCFKAGVLILVYSHHRAQNFPSVHNVYCSSDRFARGFHFRHISFDFCSKLKNGFCFRNPLKRLKNVSWITNVFKTTCKVYPLNLLKIWFWEKNLLKMSSKPGLWRFGQTL
jgi:hypothetical protein